MNQFITLFGISTTFAMNPMAATTIAPITVHLNQGRFMSGTCKLLVIASFVLTGIGLIALVGVVISLLCAPLSFWSSILNKLDACVSILLRNENQNGDKE